MWRDDLAAGRTPLFPHSISRRVLGGLTATAVSVAGLSAPAYAAAAPIFIVGGPQQVTAALGERFDATMSVTNNGDTAVDGVSVLFDTLWAHEDVEQYSNCEYDGGLVRACLFDQTLEPGGSYRLVVPFRVRADTRAPSRQDATFKWQAASEHVKAGTPGTGPALRLQEGERIGSADDPNWQEFTVNVTGNQNADLVAIGGTAAGWVGAVVEAEVGVRNDGPATLDFSRSGTAPARVVVTPPAGTSIVEADGCYRFTSTAATCGTEYRLKVGEVKTWKLGLRIDRSVPGAAGSVVVNSECTCDGYFGDTDKSNNNTALTVSASVDDVKPVIEDAGIATDAVAYTAYFWPRVRDNVKVARLEVTGSPASARATCTPRTSSDTWECKMTQEVADGTEARNVVTITAYDAAGNASEPVSTPVLVDRKLPKYTVSPAPGTSVRSGPMTIELNGVPADMTEVRVFDRDTDKVLATLTRAPWRYVWNASDDSTPIFLAVDKVGNPWYVGADYIVDDESPVINQVSTVSRYLPNRLDTGKGWAGTKALLEYSASDESPIARTEWWVNGVRSSTAPRFAWDTRAITAPTARVEVRLTDAVGNTASKSFTVNIDRTVSATVVAPAQNTLVRGTSFVTSVKVGDPRGRAWSTLLSPVRLSGSRTSAKVTAGKDGTKTIIWEVADRLGNVAQFKRTVIVDNTAPAVSFKSAPKNNTKRTKTFTVTANASDRNGIGRVELLINGKKVATDYRAGWAFKINPKKYGKKFTVQLRVYDRAGNSKLTTKRTYRR
jgi:hypothetical protein